MDLDLFHMQVCKITAGLQKLGWSCDLNMAVVARSYNQTATAKNSQNPTRWALFYTNPTPNLRFCQILSVAVSLQA